ncbi:hypothetical protein [Sphingorhabdus sp. Alg231-15]|uniref:hypothetical protein n=1 Tax=Sphingorhabdus sp. Alg231-15 TaxID=1922222 RepID=UPI00307C5249
MKRRRFLIAAAIVLIMANAYLLFSDQEDASIIYEGERWLIHMPVLEASQKLNNETLFSSHSWDDRVPVSSVIDQSFSRPSMYEDILNCEPSGIVMDTQTGDLTLPELPSRYFVWTSNVATVSCIRQNLPKGYVIKKYPTNAQKN